MNKIVKSIGNLFHKDRPSSVFIQFISEVALKEQRTTLKEQRMTQKEQNFSSHLLGDQIVLKNKLGESIKIHSEGSLGLLALGDIGLQIWRRAKLADSASSRSSTIISKSVTP